MCPAHHRCCALDVHQRSTAACVLVWDGKREFEILRFRLVAPKVDVVAMESARVYGKAVWQVLERQRQSRLPLANAPQYHGLHREKTPQGDAAWLGELLPCGLRKGRFPPPPWQCEWRDLTRS